MEHDMRARVELVHPLAMAGSRTLHLPPSGFEPLARQALHSLRGWGSPDVEVAVLAAATWRYPGRLSQARVQAALRANFGETDWQALFVSRLSRSAPTAFFTLARAAGEAASCRMQLATMAMQGIRYLCNAWMCARRMGRTPRGCVFGCLVENGIRHYSVCADSLGVVTCARGLVHPPCGVRSPVMRSGANLRWRRRSTILPPTGETQRMLRR